MRESLLNHRYDEVTLVNSEKSRWILLRNCAFGFSLGAAIGIAVVTLIPRTYESSFRVAPSSSSMTALSGLAQAVGLDADGEAARNPEYYADLVTSLPVILSLLASDLPSEAGGGSIQLEYGSLGPDSFRMLDKTIRRVRESISVEPSRKTGTLRVKVRASSRERARAIASTLLRVVDSLDQEVKQQIPAAEREFAEVQLRIARDDLVKKEEAQRVFVSRNRRFTESPELQLEFDRHRRGVEMQQSLVMHLAQAYQKAVLDERNNTPRLLVIEPPSKPILPLSRHGAMIVLATSSVGLAVGAVGWRALPSAIVRFFGRAWESSRPRPT